MDKYKAAFFKLYEEHREIGDCGDCPVIDNGDGTCPALYADGSGSDESLCREQIFNCYMESDNYVDNG